MNNIGKYAAAGEATIVLHCEDSRLRMVIADNGRGFDSARFLRDSPLTGKMGILSMQERAGPLGGVLKIRSERGKGTMVTVDVPLSQTA